MHELEYNVDNNVYKIRNSNHLNRIYTFPSHESHITVKMVKEMQICIVCIL